MFKYIKEKIQNITTGVNPSTIKSKNDTILFVFQHWNDKYNWWHPNTIPLNFIVNGEKRLPATHDFMWFDVGTIRDDDTQNNKWFTASASKREILSEHPNVKFIKFSDIGDQKYVFPIFMPANSYFKVHQTIGFNYVDPQIIKDIRNKKALMLLICPNEGMSGADHNSTDFDILNHWCKEYELPKESVYYFHGNLKVSDHDKNFNYVPMDLFPDWIDYNKESIVPFQADSDKNLFLCYNRRPRLHRIITICELMRNNLTNRGIYSFGQRDSKPLMNFESFFKNNYSSELLIEFYKLNRKVYIEIDIDLLKNNPANLVVPNHYKKTFVSIITETLTSDKTIFFSEKIYKSIAVGHPFMVVSSPGFLKELRNRGYKTFDRWFDESYDDLPKMEDRVFAIVKEVKRLSTLSLEELKSIREEMIPVLQHNQDVFLNIRKTQFDNDHADHYMYTEIKKIWDKFNND